MVPSLTTMPPEILGMIFNCSDFVTIQIVRKVCRHLRNHIDHFPPDSKLYRVIVKTIKPKRQPDLTQNQRISVMYDMQNNQKIVLEYQKNGKNGCRIIHGNREKTIENQDFASVLGNDLGLILKNQNSKMFAISFNFPSTFKLRLSENCLETFHGQFLVAMTPHMESRNTTISTLMIVVGGTNQESQISKFLRFLDPFSLGYITIFDKRPGFASPTMKIDRLIELEQWKQAKEISIYGLSLASGIENFSHLEYFAIELKQISGEELVLLKEAFIHRISFVNPPTIRYRHLKDPGPFTSFFEEPRSYEPIAWFNVPNNNENALRIRWYPRHKWISFECKKRAFANGAVFN